jgi:hypothetical protein
MTVYPKVSGLAAWSENCKWYSSLPLGAVVSLFCECLIRFAAITLCVAFRRVFIVVVVVVYLVMTQSGNFWIYPRIVSIGLPASLVFVQFLQAPSGKVP